jgi:hypothetical protein
MSKPATDPAANLARFERRRYRPHAEMKTAPLAAPFAVRVGNLRYSK